MKNSNKTSSLKNRGKMSKLSVVLIVIALVLSVAGLSLGLYFLLKTPDVPPETHPGFTPEQEKWVDAIIDSNNPSTDLTYEEIVIPGGVELRDVIYVSNGYIVSKDSEGDHLIFVRDESNSETEGEPEPIAMFEYNASTVAYDTVVSFYGDYVHVKDSDAGTAYIVNLKTLEVLFDCSDFSTIEFKNGLAILVEQVASSSIDEFVCFHLGQKLVALELGSDESVWSYELLDNVINVTTDSGVLVYSYALVNGALEFVGSGDNISYEIVEDEYVPSEDEVVIEYDGENYIFRNKQIVVATTKTHQLIKRMEVTNDFENAESCETFGEENPQSVYYDIKFFVKDILTGEEVLYETVYDLSLHISNPEGGFYIFNMRNFMKFDASGSEVSVGKHPNLMLVVNDGLNVLFEYSYQQYGDIIYASNTNFVTTGGVYSGIIDKNGTDTGIIDTKKYNITGKSIWNNMFIVGSNGYYGISDIMGAVVVSPVFDEISPIVDGYAIGYMDGHYYNIDLVHRKATVIEDYYVPFHSYVMMGMGCYLTYDQAGDYYAIHTANGSMLYNNISEYVYTDIQKPTDKLNLIVTVGSVKYHFSCSASDKKFAQSYILNGYTAREVDVSCAYSLEIANLVMNELTSYSSKEYLDSQGSATGVVSNIVSGNVVTAGGESGFYDATTGDGDVNFEATPTGGNNAAENIANSIAKAYNQYVGSYPNNGWSVSGTSVSYNFSAFAGHKGTIINRDPSSTGDTMTTFDQMFLLAPVPFYLNNNDATTYTSYFSNYNEYFAHNDSSKAFGYDALEADPTLGGLLASGTINFGTTLDTNWISNNGGGLVPYFNPDTGEISYSTYFPAMSTYNSYDQDAAFYHAGTVFFKYGESALIAITRIAITTKPGGDGNYSLDRYSGFAYRHAGEIFTYYVGAAFAEGTAVTKIYAGQYENSADFVSDPQNYVNYFGDEYLGAESSESGTSGNPRFWPCAILGVAPSSNIDLDYAQPGVTVSSIDATSSWTQELSGISIGVNKKAGLVNYSNGYSLYMRSFMPNGTMTSNINHYDGDSDVGVMGLRYYFGEHSNSASVYYNKFYGNRTNYAYFKATTAIYVSFSWGIPEASKIGVYLKSGTSSVDSILEFEAKEGSVLVRRSSYFTFRYEYKSLEENLLVISPKDGYYIAGWGMNCHVYGTGANNGWYWKDEAGHFATDDPKFEYVKEATTIYGAYIPAGSWVMKNVYQDKEWNEKVDWNKMDSVVVYVKAIDYKVNIASYSASAYMGEDAEPEKISDTSFTLYKSRELAYNRDTLEGINNSSIMTGAYQTVGTKIYYHGSMYFGASDVATVFTNTKFASRINGLYNSNYYKPQGLISSDNTVSIYLAGSSAFYSGDWEYDADGNWYWNNDGVNNVYQIYGDDACVAPDNGLNGFLRQARDASVEYAGSHTLNLFVPLIPEMFDFELSFESQINNDTLSSAISANTAMESADIDSILVYVGNNAGVLESFDADGKCTDNDLAELVYYNGDDGFIRFYNPEDIAGFKTGVKFSVEYRSSDALTMIQAINHYYSVLAQNDDDINTGMTLLLRKALAETDRFPELISKNYQHVKFSGNVPKFGVLKLKQNNGGGLQEDLQEKLMVLPLSRFEFSNFSKDTTSLANYDNDEPNIFYPLYEYKRYTTVTFDTNINVYSANNNSFAEFNAVYAIGGADGSSMSLHSGTTYASYSGTKALTSTSTISFSNDDSGTDKGVLIGVKNDGNNILKVYEFDGWYANSNIENKGASLFNIKGESSATRFTIPDIDDDLDGSIVFYAHYREASVVKFEYTITLKVDGVDQNTVQEGRELWAGFTFDVGSTNTFNTITDSGRDTNAPARNQASLLSQDISNKPYDLGGGVYGVQFDGVIAQGSQLAFKIGLDGYFMQSIEYDVFNYSTNGAGSGVLHFEYVSSWHPLIDDTTLRVQTDYSAAQSTYGCASVIHDSDQSNIVLDYNGSMKTYLCYSVGIDNAPIGRILYNPSTGVFTYTAGTIVITLSDKSYKADGGNDGTIIDPDTKAPEGFVASSNMHANLDASNAGNFGLYNNIDISGATFDSLGVITGKENVAPATGVSNENSFARPMTASAQNDTYVEIIKKDEDDYQVSDNDYVLGTADTSMDADWVANIRKGDIISLIAKSDGKVKLSQDLFAPNVDMSSTFSEAWNAMTASVKSVDFYVQFGTDEIAGDPSATVIVGLVGKDGVTFALRVGTKYAYGLNFHIEFNAVYDTQNGKYEIEIESIVAELKYFVVYNNEICEIEFNDDTVVWQTPYSGEQTYKYVWEFDNDKDCLTYAYDEPSKDAANNLVFDKLLQNGNQVNSRRRLAIFRRGDDAEISGVGVLNSSYVVFADAQTQDYAGTTGFDESSVALNEASDLTFKFVVRAMGNNPFGSAEDYSLTTSTDDSRYREALITLWNPDFNELSTAASQNHIDGFGVELRLRVNTNYKFSASFLTRVHDESITAVTPKNEGGGVDVCLEGDVLVENDMKKFSEDIAKIVSGELSYNAIQNAAYNGATNGVYAFGTNESVDKISYFYIKPKDGFFIEEVVLDYIGYDGNVLKSAYLLKDGALTMGAGGNTEYSAVVPTDSSSIASFGPFAPVFAYRIDDGTYLKSDGYAVNPETGSFMFALAGAYEDYKITVKYATARFVQVVVSESDFKNFFVNLEKDYDEIFKDIKTDRDAITEIFNDTTNLEGEYTLAGAFLAEMIESIEYIDESGAVIEAFVDYLSGANGVIVQAEYMAIGENLDQTYFTFSIPIVKASAGLKITTRNDADGSSAAAIISMTEDGTSATDILNSGQADVVVERYQSDDKTQDYHIKSVRYSPSVHANARIVMRLSREFQIKSLLETSFGTFRNESIDETRVVDGVTAVSGISVQFFADCGADAGGEESCSYVKADNGNTHKAYGTKMVITVSDAFGGGYYAPEIRVYYTGDDYSTTGLSILHKSPDDYDYGDEFVVWLADMEQSYILIEVRQRAEMYTVSYDYNGGIVKYSVGAQGAPTAKAMYFNYKSSLDAKAFSNIVKTGYTLLGYTYDPALTGNDIENIENGHIFELDQFVTSADSYSSDKFLFTVPELKYNLAYRDYGEETEEGSHSYNVVLYAVWSPSKYTISYNLNDVSQGKGSTQAVLDDLQENTIGKAAAGESYYLYYGHAFGWNNLAGEVSGKVFASASRDGYTFVGWSYNSNSTELVAETDIIDEEKADSNNVIVLYAVWTPIVYTITFSKQDDTDNVGSSEAVLDDDPSKSRTVCFDGEFMNLPLAERVGYNFVGWYTSLEEGAVKIEHEYAQGNNTKLNGTLLESFADGAVDDENKSLVLYAKWEAQSFRIFYSLANSGLDGYRDTEFITFGVGDTVHKNEACSNSAYFDIVFDDDEAVTIDSAFSNVYDFVGWSYKYKLESDADMAAGADNLTFALDMNTFKKLYFAKYDISSDAASSVELLSLTYTGSQATRVATLFAVFEPKSFDFGIAPEVDASENGYIQGADDVTGTMVEAGKFVYDESNVFKFEIVPSTGYRIKALTLVDFETGKKVFASYKVEWNSTTKTISLTNTSTNTGVFGNTACFGAVEVETSSYNAGVGEDGTTYQNNINLTKLTITNPKVSMKVMVEFEIQTFKISVNIQTTDSAGLQPAVLKGYYFVPYGSYAMVDERGVPLAMDKIQSVSLDYSNNVEVLTGRLWAKHVIQGHDFLGYFTSFVGADFEGDGVDTNIVATPKDECVEFVNGDNQIFADTTVTMAYAKVGDQEVIFHIWDNSTSSYKVLDVGDDYRILADEDGNAIVGSCINEEDSVVTKLPSPNAGQWPVGTIFNGYVIGKKDMPYKNAVITTSASDLEELGYSSDEIYDLVTDADEFSKDSSDTMYSSFTTSTQIGRVIYVYAVYDVKQFKVASVHETVLACHDYNDYTHTVRRGSTSISSNFYADLVGGCVVDYTISYKLAWFKDISADGVASANYTIDSVETVVLSPTQIDRYLELINSGATREAALNLAITEVEFDETNSNFFVFSYIKDTSEGGESGYIYYLADKVVWFTITSMLPVYLIEHRLLDSSTLLEIE